MTKNVVMGDMYGLMAVHIKEILLMMSSTFILILDMEKGK
jgi:hypothetical protein